MIDIRHLLKLCF